MKPNGRGLATLAVGVAIGAGIAIPASALAQGRDGQPPASQSHAVDNGGSMRGHHMGSMMSMMRAMPAEDGSTGEEMKTMARECAQMMRDPAMQRMHQRMMDPHMMDEGADMGQMHDRMRGDG